MQKLRRALALLLVACMLLTNGSLGALADSPQPEEPETAPAAAPEEEAEALLTLPASLEAIGEEAFFEDESLGEVVLPDNIRTIGPRAFARSSVTKIHLPDSLTKIDVTAFDEVEGLTVTANEGTYAYTWAVENGFIVEGVAINETNFPDGTFRTYVSQFDTDGDGVLSESEIAAVTEMNVPTGVVDLTGVGFFVDLRSLNCRGIGMNPGVLETLDVSALAALERLNCSGNRLSALDVTQNGALVELDCSHNQIEELILTENHALTKLYCDGNALTALDLSGNPELSELTMSQMKLENLDLTHNPKLAHIEGGPQAMDIRGCTALVAAYLPGVSEDYDRPVWLPDNVDVYCDENGSAVMMIDHETVITAFDPVVIDGTSFPDESFRAFVADMFDTDADGVLSGVELAAVTTIDCAEMGIADLTGVKLFPRLRELYCQFNELSALDVSGLSRLYELWCFDNSLGELNVAGCGAMLYLGCSRNRLTALDLSACPRLLEMSCNGNVNLSELNLDGCTELRELYCNNTQVGALDLSEMEELEILYCMNSGLNELDVSGCPALTWLSCANNALNGLDLSNNHALTGLMCSGCGLESLVLRFCEELEQLECEGNPLTELEICFCTKLLVAVEEGEESVNVERNLRVYEYDGELGYFLLTLPADTELVTESDDIRINAAQFPDDSFRAYVADVLDPDRDGFLTPAERDGVKKLSVPYAGIKDLSGLELFTALEELNCSGNQLKSLDVSANTALKRLVCSSCGLSGLNLSANADLLALYCENNPLGSLSIGENISLEELGCANCGLDELIVSGNPELKRLFCQYNELESLDVSGNDKLQELGCAHNQLGALVLEGNPALVWLDCSQNFLGTLNVRPNTALQKLFCMDCGLTSLDLSLNEQLTDLNCGSNSLTALNVSGNHALVELNCPRNELASLNLSENPVLAVLACGFNSIGELDLSENPNLNSLLCQNNSLTGLDLSANGELWELVCTGNAIDELDLTPCEKLSLVWNMGKQETDGKTWRDYTFGAAKGYYYLSVPYGTVITAPFPGVNIDANTFPDENFRRYVGLHLDADEDNILSAEELAAVKSLSLGDEGIVNLLGIEYFTELESLDCAPTEPDAQPTLRYAKLSENTKLKSVNLAFNPIQSLNVSALSALESLNLRGTGIRGVYLGANSELRELWVNETGIGYLDVTDNGKLELLDCTGCENLYYLDLSGCPSLAADYNAGGRHLAWLEAMAPEYARSFYVYGGQGDANYTLAVSTWTEVYAPLRPEIVSVELGEMTRIVDVRSDSYGYYIDGVYTPSDTWQEINCWPSDLPMRVEVSRFGMTKTYEGSGNQVMSQLEDDGYLVDWFWTSDETPDALWDVGEHTAVLHYCALEIPYTVHVIENPVASVSVTAIERFIFERSRMDHRQDDNGEWYYDPWDRVDCWPHDATVTVVFTDEEREPLSGSLQEIWEELEELSGGDWGWNSDERWDDPWEPGMHKAVFNVGSVSCEYDVLVKADPIRELVVNGEVTRYLGGQTQTVGGYEYYNEETGKLEWVSFIGDYDRLDVNPADLPMSAVTNEWIEDESEEGGGRYRTIDGDDLGDLLDKLEEEYGVRFNCHWESDESPWYRWNTPGDYTAWQIIGPWVGEYTVHVRVNPIASVSVSSIERYIFRRSEMDQRQDEYGNWYYDPWDRVDCWPDGATVTVTFTDEERAPVSGRLYEVEDELREEFDLWWESDESWDNPWQPGEHTARFYVEGVCGEYAVTVLPDPVASLAIDPAHDTVYRFETDRRQQNGYDDGSGWIEHTWYQIDAWPRNDESLRLTVTLTDGSVYSDTADKVQDDLNKAGYDNLLGWHSSENPDKLWEADVTYACWLDAGGQSAEYWVSVQADPILSVTVDGGVRRVLGDCFESNDWVDDQNTVWMQHDCYIRQNDEAVLSVETTEGTFSGDMDSVRRELSETFGTDIDLHWESGESREEPWEEPGEYLACAVVGGHRSEPYPVTLIENPIQELWADDVYHTVGMADYWDFEAEDWRAPGSYEYIDCNFDTINAVATLDGEELSFRGDEGGFHDWLQRNFRIDLNLSYRYAEEPDHWEPGGEYDAILSLGPEREPIMETGYRLITVENPIRGIRIDYQHFLSTSRFESWSYKPIDGWWAPTEKPWSQLNVTPYIHVLLADGEELEGSADEVFARLNGELEQPALHYYLVSEEQPDAPWYEGAHSALLIVGTTGYYYGFDIVDNPIAYIEVEDIARSENNLSTWTEYDYYDEEAGEQVTVSDAKPWRIECYPDTLTVTLTDGFCFADGEQSATFTTDGEGGCFRKAEQALYEATGVMLSFRWDSAQQYGETWTEGYTGEAWVLILELGGETYPYNVTVTGHTERVMLVASGPVWDGGFNEASYTAARAFCDENGIECDWLSEYGDKDLYELVEFAADLGNTVLILPGFEFGPIAAELAPEYPELRFILLDVSEGDVLGEEGEALPENVVCTVYREEIAGYMAGYAAVKLGYSKLGFLGGFPVPGVKRYGYGFVQGADAAAAELGADVSIRYAYAGQFMPESWITAAMDNWYEDEIEAVFACGGGIGYSVAEAARANDGRIIGVDVDQAGDFGGDVTLTSAMKCLGVTVKAQLEAIVNDSFAGGTAAALGLVSDRPEENYVQLAPSTQFGEGFDYDDYAALVAAIRSGALTVSDDTDVSVESLATVAAVEDLGTLRPEELTL